jgi:hypothetical protein
MRIEDSLLSIFNSIKEQEGLEPAQILKDPDLGNPTVKIPADLDLEQWCIV